MTEKALLLFSLGPVQDFIAAARKTRDLFAGSLMLSYLSTKAIEGILIEANKNGQSVSMMFPDVRLENGKLSTKYEDASIPNRFLVDVSGYPFDKVNDLAKAGKNKVMEEFASTLDSAKKHKCFSITSDPVWDKCWDEQSNKFIECYWVVQTGPAADYGKLYRSTEQLSGKRKLLRDFSELEFRVGMLNDKGQPGVKCTLIPGLSAVHDQNAVGDKKIKEFWKMIVKKKPGEFRMGERLSTVALGKRFFLSLYLKMDDSFPSTTTIAAGAFNKAIVDQYAVDTDLRTTIGEYAKKVKALVNSLGFPHPIANIPLIQSASNGVADLKDFVGLDSDWLYEEMYKAETLEKEFGVSPDAGKLKEAKEACSNLHGVVGKVNQKNKKSVIPGVCKYYAIIFFDGDSMGKWLSGAMGNKIGPDEHKRLSENLRYFSTPQVEGQTKPDAAQGVYDIVESNHLGKIVYSGGDDVLAFVALDDCLEVVLEIRQGFLRWMENAGCKRATGSLGMAIAHHQMNLQQVLQEARRAEHYAKEGLDRDALAIALLKRSGEHFTTGARWFTNNGNVGTVSTMQEFINLIRNKVISTKFVHDLEDERIGLSVFEPDRGADPAPVLAEIGRLLKRHSRNDEESKRQVTDFQKNYIDPLYHQLTSVPQKKKPETDELLGSLEQLIDLLKVAQFIAQGGAR